jgi:tetratricopeptide (TPR) repeat protein
VKSEPNAEQTFDLRKQIESAISRRFGRRGLIIFSCSVLLLGVWWKWNEVKEAPGVAALVRLVAQKSLPTAVPGKFNVAIAHLKGDGEQHQNEELIRDSLKEEFPSVVTLSFDRLIAPDEANSMNAEHEGIERARALLATSGADVLIWGHVIQHDGNSLPKLYWTPTQNLAHGPPAARYQVTETLGLPVIFWRDLTGILGLLIATRDAELSEKDNRYTADKLKLFIARVRALVTGSKAEHWDSFMLARVQLILGSALQTYGEQTGENPPLQDAVTFYREALHEQTRAKAPLDWAVIENNLGVALEVLGERSSDEAQLNDAVIAYRAALTVYTRAKDPLKWAMTQNNLGNVFKVLGDLTSDPTRLTDATAAYREVLKEYTREKAPLDWAGAQNNLGATLETLGERSSDTSQLADALIAYREALKEYTRDTAPLRWAGTQNNLGNTLTNLGARSSDSERLTEAVTAYRAALEEYTHQKTPLDWAMAQNGLGIALTAQGELSSDAGRLANAMTAFHEALKVFTPDKTPLDWAKTQSNLGTALEILGRLSSDTARLNEAENAYQAAIAVFREKNVSNLIQGTERKIQRVRGSIERRKTTKKASASWGSFKNRGYGACRVAVGTVFRTGL